MRKLTEEEVREIDALAQVERKERAEELCLAKSEASEQKDRERRMKSKHEELLDAQIAFFRNHGEDEKWKGNF